jgi:hypothetical protein
LNEASASVVEGELYLGNNFSVLIGGAISAARHHANGTCEAVTTGYAPPQHFDKHRASRQITPKHQGRPAIIEDQRTRPVNKIDNPAKSPKPPSPVQIRAAPPIPIVEL